MQPVRAVAGSFAELRVYLWHCAAVFRPGMDVPGFALPAVFDGDLHRMTDDDLKLIVEEGRRQIDRQLGDLERIRSRGVTLVTVGLGAIALLSSGARRAFAAGTWETAAWSAAGLLVVLGLAGAIAVLTAKAVFGRTDASMAAALAPPVLRPLAVAYAQQVGYGEETVRTRLTVLRDAVLLLVLGALVYAGLWPFTR
jgi:hypothetical protein